MSIVIPAYNVASLIGGALDSVFAQTETDFEVIVVNDGSPDTAKLEAVLEPYRGRIEYLVQKNGGPSAARNAGIRQARGEFVAFLDADDTLLPFFLEEHLERAESDPAADVFYGNSLIFGDVPEAGRTVMDFNPSRGPVNFVSIATWECNPQLCSLVRRRTLLQHGLFDELLGRSEDFDLWLRLAHDGVRFNYTTRVVARYRVRRDGLTADMLSMVRSNRVVFEKCTRTMNLTAKEHELVAEQIRHFVALERFCEGKRAFIARDHRLARTALAEANVSLRSRKLSLAVALLGIAPSLAWWLYHARARMLGRDALVRI